MKSKLYLKQINQINEGAILEVFFELGISGGSERGRGNETYVFQVG